MNFPGYVKKSVGLYPERFSEIPLRKSLPKLLILRKGPILSIFNPYIEFRVWVVRTFPYFILCFVALGTFVVVLGTFFVVLGSSYVPRALQD